MNNLDRRIDAVHQRAWQLHQQARAVPAQPQLLDAALHDLNVVLEELRTAYEELEQQNQALVDYRQQLEVERQRYQDLFNLAPDGYLVTDDRGIIQEANLAIAAMVQTSQAYLSGKPLALLLPEKDHSAFYTTLANLDQTSPQNQLTWETQICPRQGEPIEVAMTLSYNHQKDDGSKPLRWLIRDITQQKQAEAKIHQQAFYDQLTGLPNRAFFDAYLPKILAQAERQHTQVALGFLDLDRFKAINDTLGHGAGDLLLQQVGQRLSSCLREADLLVRWGGDEFILVLPHLTSTAAVARTCERILEALKPVFQIHHRALSVSISVGIAFFPQHGKDWETLLRHADQALYQAKRSGRDTYYLYDDSLESASAQDHGI